MNDQPLLAQVRTFLSAHLPQRPLAQPLCVALSGGLDSMVLLDVLARSREALALRVSALHVDHGLSPNAQRWAAFCSEQCAARGIALRIERVNVGATRGLGLEAAARSARYAAFARQPEDYIALAHHREDQAETLLLRLLRGAGVRGLAGMRPVRALARSAHNTRDRITLLRPLLLTSRAILQDYAAQSKLQWCTDESNANLDMDRNFLRQEILPRLGARFPHYAATFARAAQNLDEASALIDEFTAIDLAACEVDGRLQLAALRALTPARAGQVVRSFVHRYGDVSLTAAQTEELLRQLGVAGQARADAQVAFRVAGLVLRVWRGEALLARAAGAAEDRDAFAVPWRGEATLELPVPYGAVLFTHARGVGISVTKLGGAQVMLRSRRGGERLRPEAQRPTRTLKNLLQEAHMPSWQRKRLPLMFCGEDLVCVPGIAVAAEFKAQPGEEGIVVVWQQHVPEQRA